MARGTNGRHGPRVRHPKAFALLKPAQQRPGFAARRRGKRWRLDRAFQPHQGFVFAVHAPDDMSDST